MRRLAKCKSINGAAEIRLHDATDHVADLSDCPADDPSIRRENHHDAEDNAIPRERGEVMRGHVSQQPPDGKVHRRERSDRADGKEVDV